MKPTPVDHARPTHTRYIVLGALCLAAATAYLSRNILVPAEKSIEQDLGLSKEAMGFVMGSFFYTYSLMQIPGGWLNDRLGTRLALPLLAVIWAAGTAAMGVAVGSYSLLFCYLLIGLAQGGLFPGTVGCIASQEHQRGYRLCESKPRSPRKQVPKPTWDS